MGQYYIEIERMVIHVFLSLSFRMRHACSVKCKINSNKYERADIMKQDAVCLDRCVHKYMCFHENVGKRLSKDEETFKSLLFPADALKASKEDTETVA